MISNNKELFSAILAMDAYNRGYFPGLNIPGSTPSIGTATIIPLDVIFEDQSTLLTIQQAWQEAGFSATAYRLASGEIVISYRGTDNILGTVGSGSDLVNGWSFGAGFSGAS